MGLRLALDAHGRLTATTADGAHHDLSPVRCFPFTDPDRFVSLVDARGHEVLRIDDPAALEPASRELLAKELARREFLPRIKRIRDVSPRSEPSTWDVETDRGDVRFVLPSEDNLRRLPGDGVLITDAHGVRYRIVQVAALDRRSREIMRRYL
jgi:hypothetical protein